MTAPAHHDTYEARVLARLDALPPPRSADELRALDPSRGLGSSALRELARDPSLPLCLRRHFLSRAVEVGHREQDARRDEEWKAANPCDCYPAHRGHTRHCKAVRRVQGEQKARTA